MGLAIIRNQMDETAYSTGGSNNCLRLTKFLVPAAQDAGV